MQATCIELYWKTLAKSYKFEGFKKYIVKGISGQIYALKTVQTQMWSIFDWRE